MAGARRRVLTKLARSTDAVLRAVREAAARAGTSVSAWLSAAASSGLRHALLGEALDAWEAEGEPFSTEELDRAAAALDATTPDPK